MTATWNCYMTPQQWRKAIDDDLDAIGLVNWTPEQRLRAYWLLRAGNPRLCHMDHIEDRLDQMVTERCKKDDR